MINKRPLTILIAATMILLVAVKAFSFSVTAQVDRNRITMNESISLSVVFEDGEGEVDTSSITDFTVLSRSSSSNISIVNGKYSKTVSSIYRLIPKREGILRIPDLKVEYENKIYTTQQITIEVSKQTSNRSDSRDIFVEAGISGTSLFTGEQAVYQLRLYSAIRYSNAALQPPSFKGFTSKEAEERKNYNENINGRMYNVVEINYVIIPEISGELQIDPAIITCDVALRRDSRDPFDDPFFSNGFFSFGRSETRQFATDPVVVEVEALPEYSISTSVASSGVSAGNIPFSGLVGNFSISADLDKPKLNSSDSASPNMDYIKLNTGDSATFSITISGKGNLMDAQSPVVTIPAEFKVYDDSPEEKIELTLEGYFGEKIFKKAIVPVKPGKYTIEPVRLSFFNVSTRKYEVISTDPIVVEVGLSPDQQAGGQQLLNTGDDAGSNQIKGTGTVAKEKKVVELTGRDIFSIKEDTSLLVNRERLSISMFMFLFFAPCGLFFVLRVVMLISKRDISVSDTMLKKARVSLNAAEKSINKKDSGIEHHKPPHDFFKYLHDALVAMVMSKGGFAGKSITAQEATEILTAAGSGSDIADQVTALLDEIESARYGRQESDPDYRHTLLAKAKKLFQTLGAVILFVSMVVATSPEKIFADTSSESSTATELSEPVSLQSTPLSLPSALSLTTPLSEAQVSSTSAQLSSGTLFLEGVKAYHSHNFTEAAQKFSALAQRGIKNPYLYYNIGNAYIKAGDTGHAIVWYERAKKEIPLDPDLRFNLDYAKSFVTDKVESGGINISDLIFFWKDYFPPETVQYCALIISFIFFFYAGFRTFRGRKIFTPAGTVLVSALIITGCTAFYSYYHAYSNHFAVVISKEAPVRSGVSEDATQLFLLHSGTKVKVEEIKEDYLKIFFSKDKIGWISTKDAEVI
ncbi:MAG: BatD family protein [Desulfamplus sp.]|nr:BatD family protein [Desulfamplus sp.]